MVELLVASGVTGILFVSLYAGMSMSTGIVRVTRENIRAAQILQEKTETLRLYTWDQINQANFIPTNFTERYYTGSDGVAEGITYTGRVTLAQAPLTEAYSNDLKQATIQLEWVSGKSLRQREVTTWLGRYGLQTYIY